MQRHGLILIMLITFTYVIVSSLATSTAPNEEFMIVVREKLHRICSGSLELKSNTSAISLTSMSVNKIKKRNRRDMTVSNLGTCCFKLFERPYFRGRAELYLPGQTGHWRRLGSIAKRSCPNVRS